MAARRRPFLSQIFRRSAAAIRSAAAAQPRFSLSAGKESIMCGRAKLPDDVSEIKLDLKIDFDHIGDYQPRWNAAPTSKLPVVVSFGNSRILTLMRWGLIPSWAKDLKIGYSTFNARAETLTARAAFRGAWQAGRRCLVL